MKNNLYIDNINIIMIIKDLSFEEALTFFTDSVNITSLEETLNKIQQMKKDYYLKQHHNRIFFSESEKLWRTFIKDDTGKRKSVRKKDKEALEAWLVEYYYSKGAKEILDKISLEKLCPNWLKYRRDKTSVKPKTIQESVYCWNRFYKDTELAKMPIRQIKPLILTRFFREMTSSRDLTHKSVSNARGVLNGLLSYAVEEGIIETNPLRDVNFRTFTYKPVENQTSNVYQKDDVEVLLTYLEKNYESDDYALAIRLFFNLFIRIGEMKALSWNDVDFEKRTIYIHRQLLTDRILNDDMSFTSREAHVSNQIKGNTSKGFRYEFLTDDAIEILLKAKELNPDGDFIFMPKGKTMTTDRFNRKLKKYCEECGIEYHSSHKIRFYNASSAYDGNNIASLSVLMGHSEVATTIHYLRNVNSMADNSHMFANLGKSKNVI